jgi:tRNA G18 (ribose-2'-O)-methylase SpoU
MTDFSSIIADTAKNHYNVHDVFKDNTPEENKAFCQASANPFSVGAFSITGDLNIGIMIRTASLLGASKFFIFGRRKYDKRSTVGAHNYIDVHRYEATAQGLSNACTEHGQSPVFIEQGGRPIHWMGDEDWDDLSDDMIGDPMFIFGSESDGIPTEVMENFTTRQIWKSPVLSIPQRGVLRSYNVSTAMSIVCWEHFKYLSGGV